MNRAAAPPSPDVARSRLLPFYDAAARDLPWRGEEDPYRVLVSEVMLQQTRVATVERYYGAWLDRFPDIGALADAEEDEVLKAWEGLGYYRRARNLHRAARLVVRERGGDFPRTARELRVLPGVGEYSSGAVASIAFGEVVPAVDGNVRRVLARWFGESSPKAKWLRERAGELVDPDRPGDWNQALMELGATICTPTSPKCEACPMTGACVAEASGDVASYPEPVRKPDVTAATFLVGVFSHDEGCLVVKRPADGLLGGMWSFPERRLEDGDDLGEALATLAGSLSLDVVGEPTPLPDVHHRFTHLDATYRPYVIEVGSAGPAADGRLWIAPGDSIPVALPKAQQRILTSIPRAEHTSA